MHLKSQRGFVSGKTTSTLSFYWTINDFSSICANTKPMEFITSPVFTSIGSKGNWYIKLYPNNIPNDGGKIEEWLSILPDYTKDDWVRATVTISIPIKSDTNTTSYYGSNANNTIRTLTFADNQEWKCDPFIKQSEVLNTLINHSITITCSITEDIHYANVEKQIQSNMRLREFDDFEKLLQNDEHSDIVLHVGEEKLPSHKSILSLKSPVFEAMFKYDMLETKNKIVEITDIEPCVMRELLNFVYAGKVSDIKAIAKDLYIAADKYSLNSLKNICEDVICKSLTVATVVEYLNFAILYDAKKLKNKVFDFMGRNNEALKISV